MDTNQDWNALAADWQRQDTPALDVESIRSEAERRSRSLRRTVRVETTYAVLVVIVCLLIAASPGSDSVMTPLFYGLAGFLVVYQTLMVWIRRRALADAGRDALSLVEREIERARTVVRYWRWGMWSAFALWLLIYGLLMHGMAVDWPLRRVMSLVGGVCGNVVVLPAMGAYGVWRVAQAVARRRRFEALREQLRAP